MPAPGANKLKTVSTQTAAADLIAKGMGRKEVCDWLESQGMERKNAYTIYYNALKDLVPEDNLVDDHKRYLIQQNLDRLEKIINTCIDGNVSEKKVALQAIGELNKVIGAYDDKSQVMIAQNDRGEQMIKIEFAK